LVINNIFITLPKNTKFMANKKTQKHGRPPLADPLTPVTVFVKTSKKEVARAALVATASRYRYR
jgi:hypothetical protein